MSLADKHHICLYLPSIVPLGRLAKGQIVINEPGHKTLLLFICGTERFVLLNVYDAQQFITCTVAGIHLLFLRVVSHANL